MRIILLTLVFTLTSFGLTGAMFASNLPKKLPELIPDSKLEIQNIQAAMLDVVLERGQNSMAPMLRDILKLLKDGDHERALEKIAELAKNPQSQQEAYQLYVYAYLSQGKLKDAEFYVRENLKIGKDKATAEVAAAYFYIRTRKALLGAKHIINAATLEPRLYKTMVPIMAYAMIGMTHEDRQNHQALKLIIDNLIENEPKEVLTWRLEGLRLIYFDGANQDGMARLRKNLSILTSENTRLPEDHLLLFISSWSSYGIREANKDIIFVVTAEQAREVIGHFNKWARTKPLNTDMSVFYDPMLRNVARFKLWNEGNEICKTYIDVLFPDYAMTPFGVQGCMRLLSTPENPMQDLPKAIEFYEKVEKRIPQGPLKSALKKPLALIYWAQKDYKKSQDIRWSYLLEVPEDTAEFNNLIEHYFHLGLPQEIVSKYEAYALREKIKPTASEPDVWFSIASGYMEIGRLREARSYYVKFLATYPPASKIEKGKVENIISAIDAELAKNGK